MKKEIKQIGNSVGITFSPEEQRIYEIEVKKIFDVELSPEETKSKQKKEKNETQ